MIMTCQSCEYWNAAPPAKPRRAQPVGSCKLDQRPCHAGFHCFRYNSRQGRDRRLGLTSIEVAWIKANQGTSVDADNLVILYNLVADCPADPGARGIFAATLADWRRRRNTRLLESFFNESSGDNSVATEESRSHHDQQSRNHDTGAIPGNTRATDHRR